MENKQIEEMAKTVCRLDRTCDECMTSFECKAMMYAKRFYNAGYRFPIYGNVNTIILSERDLNFIKKKYTEGEG